jgi:hypothetical protein
MIGTMRTTPICMMLAVGDNISIAGDIYRIKKITLLYTEMVAINGEVRGVETS